jgi:uncharacterized coiled-coil protein SlyX
LNWFNKIVLKIASEVHKSKIDELEKRIASIEKKHEVFNKSISDNEKVLEKLENRLYQSDMKIAKFEGAFVVILDKAKHKKSLMYKEVEENG